MRRRLLPLSHPWLDAIGADPDDIRALVAAVGAPYPARFGPDPITLTGRKSGVSIHIRRFATGGHHVDHIAATAGTATWPADLVPGEPRAAVHARLGPPAIADVAEDRWSLDAGRYLAVRFDRHDTCCGVAVGLAD